MAIIICYCLHNKIVLSVEKNILKKLKLHNCTREQKTVSTVSISNKINILITD